VVKMADKQIGIRLDVKHTGLQQVDDALDTISKNLKSLNESVLKQQQRGWGSEAQTKELREQLRAMEQLLRYSERLAQTQGLHSTNFARYRQVIHGMNQDLSNLPTRSRIGGWIQDRYGEKAAEQFSKLTDAIGKLSMIYSGFNLMSTLRQGMTTGQTLAFGFGDLAKRMIPNGGSALAYGRNLLASMQGYGYSDTDLLQAATMYGNTTGRMPQGQFQAQMQAILQTGRRFGWDLSSTTQYFASAYQSGVTGGSNAQMSPQEFATLVANATVRAGMQGREVQFMNQLTALTQMTLASMGGAGDNRTMSAFLALGDRSGNQGLINNLPNMIQGINQGIMHPTGGYLGQALMMRAIGQGKMGYYQELYQQSLGAFGVGPNGKTNVENATDYLLSVYGNDPYKAAIMLGQFFNMSPADAMNYIKTYTKGGKFRSEALNQLRSQMSQTPSTINQNDVDRYRNDFMYKNYQADQAGMSTVPLQGGVNSVEGGILSVLGTPLGIGAIGLNIFGNAYGLYKGAKGVYNFGKNLLTKGGLRAGASVAAGAGAVAEGAAGVETAMGIAGGLEAAGAAADATGVGLPVGLILGLAGLVTAGGAGLYSWWKHKHSGSSSSSSSSAPIQEPSVPQSTDATTIGTQLAPVVVSTIVALQPYMDQIRSALGTSTNTGSTTSPSNAPSVSSNFGTSLTIGSNWKSGLMNLSYGGSSNVPALGRISGGVSASSMGFTGTQSDFVKKMLPYAQQVSQATGLPVDFILTQWGLESGWGTSEAARENNNFAGIKPWGNYGAGPDSMYAGYASIQDFANGYTNFLTQNPRYKSLLNAARNGASEAELAQILGASGYAEDGSYASKILRTLPNVQQALRVSGSVTVHLQQADGTRQSVNVPLTATWTNL
jgi:hypothetical protein